MAAPRSCDRCQLRFQHRRASHLYPRLRYFRPLSIEAARVNNRGRKGEHMNTKLDINTQRRAFGASVVTLLVGVVVVLLLGGSSVQAQTTTTDGASTVDSSITVPTTGTVTEGSTTVTLNGGVTIKCRRVIDDTSTTRAPIVMLD